jgi:hypothetical protein
MRHDPERAAAAYLAGELGRRQRERFEAHVLNCDDCWREVDIARRGRALAESMRQVAPQHLRERVRATVAATPLRPRRRLRVPLALGAVLAMAALAVIVVGGVPPRPGDRAAAPPQPAEIAAAVAAFQEGGTGWTPAAGPPPAQARQVDGLRWQGSSRGRVGDLPVVAHTYQDAFGRRVVLLRAARSFPQAAGAHHEAGGATWIADVDGVVLLCADRPVPSLVVGQDRAEVLVLARALKLR